MAEYHLGRSEYRFDPTATKAVARADRERLHTLNGNSYHASPSDLERFTGFVFEPTKPISNKWIRRARYLRGLAESKMK